MKFLKKLFKRKKKEEKNKQEPWYNDKGYVYHSESMYDGVSGACGVAYETGVARCAGNH